MSDTTTPESDFEAKCQRLIDLYGGVAELEKDPSLSAVAQVVNHIFECIPESDYEDLLAGAGFDIDEDEEILEDEDALREAVEDQLRNMFAYHEPFEPGELALYRAIRVSCPPSEVVVEPVGREIGVSWSTESSMKHPDFLNQYGVDGGRDVMFQATARKDQVDWLATFVTQITPTTADYEEIVMMGDGRLADLVVTDPDAPAAEAVEKRRPAMRA